MPSRCNLWPLGRNECCPICPPQHGKLCWRRNWHSGVESMVNAKGPRHPTCDAHCSEPHHGTNVAVLSKPDSMLTEAADAVFITTPNRAVLMSTAECSPVFFTDPNCKTAALAHAGGKGIDQRISEKVMDVFSHHGTKAPSDIRVWIAPSSGPCCYRLKEANQAKHPKWQQFVQQETSGLFKINLWGALKAQLLRSGILEEHIAESHICTACNTRDFFS